MAGPLRRVIAALFRNRGIEANMRRERFRAIFENQAYQRMECGAITSKEYAKAVQALEDDEVCDETIARIERGADEYEGRFTWETIREFIAANWLSILRLAITLFFMFADKRNAQAENNRRNDNT